MNTCYSLVVSSLVVAVLCGCSSQTTISTVRITDPDAGMLIDVPVQADGTFSQQDKKADVVCLTSGKVRDQGDFYSVDLVYERKSYSGPGKFKSDKIETTFKAKPSSEVPIGKNPSLPDTEPVSQNALTNVTVELLKNK